MTITSMSAPRRVAIRLLAVAALSATLGACAPLVVGGAAVGTALVAVDRRSSGAQLDDQAIELRASNRVREQLGERANVYVTSYNRQVLLTGEAASEAVKTQVQTIVAGVDNVRTIVNELGVINSPGLSQRSTDTLLTGRVKAAFVDARNLDPTAVKVVTTRNVVYLLGRVTQREADRATEVTRNISGVQRVVRVFEIITEEELARLLAPRDRQQTAPPAPAN